MSQQSSPAKLHFLADSIGIAYPFLKRMEESRSFPIGWNSLDLPVKLLLNQPLGYVYSSLSSASI
jgi:hypothetical protein